MRLPTEYSRVVRNDLSATIGVVARKARKALNLTQADVSDLIGLSSEFYARIERGHALPSVETLYKMATVLQVDADILLGHKGHRSMRRHTAKKMGPEAYDAESGPAELREVVRRLRTAPPATLRLIACLLKAFDEAETIARRVRRPRAKRPRRRK